MGAEAKLLLFRGVSSDEAIPNGSSFLSIVPRREVYKSPKRKGIERVLQIAIKQVAKMQNLVDGESGPVEALFCELSYLYHQAKASRNPSSLE